MRLTDLDPAFLRYEPEGDQIIMRRVDVIAEAQGVSFLCPKCFAANGGPRGAHAVICWSRSRGTPEDARPGPGRWALDGTGFPDLTLGADPPNSSSSVQLTGGCNWHGHVIDGEA